MRNPRGGDSSWLLWALGIGGAVAAYLATRPQAAPLSIYPEYGYLAQTSMAKTPAQKASTAPLPPTPLFTSVQQQEQSALLSQCVGSYPGCSPMSGDTQLGL